MPRLRSCWVVLFVVLISMLTNGCSSSSAPPPISVSLVPSSPQTIDQGQTVSITAAVANDSSGVSWNLNGPGTLSGATRLSVTYNPPTTAITRGQQATVTATSAADKTKSASLQITVNASPDIPFQALADGSVGVPYSQAITLTGGTAPFQWSVYNGPIITGWRIGGAVPDGLTMDSKTGTISGTPTAAGTWYFEAIADDAAGSFASNGFLSIKIEPIAPPGNPLPFLNQQLVPTAVSPGSPEFTLNVSGAGFVSGATVDFNGASLATTFADNDHLTAIVPAEEVASAATAAVTVVNPGPGGGRSNAAYFHVAGPATSVHFAASPGSPLPIQESLRITTADLNEDGKPDLAIAGNVQTYVFLGNGDGTFTPAAGSPMRMPSPPYDNFASPYTGPIAAGDFNNSGHLGLAVGEFQNMAVVILLGRGDGTFVFSSAEFAQSLGGSMSDVQPADFNGDGNLDLAVANEFTGVSPVVLGYGSGAFNTAGNLYTLSFAVGEATGDFNADGKLDVIVASGGTDAYPYSSVSVSLGKGNGTFTQGSGSPVSVGKNLSAIVAADFNGDGNLDLAVTDYDRNTAMIMLGNGDGTFGSPATIAVGNQPYSILAGDFNRDGKVDLAVANYGDGTITLLLGNGDGTFTEASDSPYAAGSDPYQMVTADFNGDGKLDLAVVNLTAGTVSILLQE